MRDENQRMQDMNDEEKAKNNYTYFNGYDQRQNDLQNRLKQFEENQRRARENYNQFVASPQANRLASEAVR